ncbi:hypothetical protein SAMN04487820_107248 [Actinopolyspora mzabensis]|uniref:Calcineurin-like phosphoesterase n=1 Tax=Actinopolyspora mzabensis TaxID=995066 RepID=A0A1G9BMU2_ACTMZ|nr:hypothetical protein [Actinopolyspora mzabensis]SDK40792.1 hypothetical protein SAMN04487820_107248 [Actinopolyspora mzabensis]
MLLSFHHPSVRLHKPYGDGIRQRRSDRLAELVERFPAIAAVLCGHAHTAAGTIFAGKSLVVAAGDRIGSQTALGGGEGAGPRGPPPGLAFHVLENGTLTTHYRYLT